MDRMLRTVGRWLKPSSLNVKPIWLTQIRAFLAPPCAAGTRLTRKRLLNCYRVRWEMMRYRAVVRSLPVKLTIEATNVCNLRCPACFTGDGQSSRVRSALAPDLWERLLAELGDTLCEVEFCNWGEPLLNKQIHRLIRGATDRGIGTVISTNFSFPFSDARAEELVRSGLTVLGVSLDGSRQETYEQYRVGGDLGLVLENCRRVRDAKRRLGSTTPKMTWSLHIFPHNIGDVDAAAAMARELDMDLSVSKGWVVGEEWGRGTALEFPAEDPFPCLFLWHQAVVNADGGVSPCCGTFYREDDMGQLAIRPGDGGASTFREIWNGERFRRAREMYRARDAATPEAREQICYECPVTTQWARWQSHRAAGGTLDTFPRSVSANDGFNFFWNRRPPTAKPPRRLSLGTR